MRTRSLPALLWAVLGAVALPASANEAGVRIRIDSPLEGQVVRNRIDLAPLSGVASAGERPTPFDVMLVLDVSHSTRYPSGTDVDGDGEIGITTRPWLGPVVACTDPDDTILAAEVRASLQLLDSFDAERVHVGVIAFAGETDPSTRMRGDSGSGPVDAQLLQPLTSDHEAVRRVLSDVLVRGAHGGTNMAAGVELAVRELAGADGALSRSRPEARRVMLLLTDGAPSLPFGRADTVDERDVQAVLDASDLAAVERIRINVFGLGPAAIDHPATAVSVAARTGGSYTPVRRPGDIVAILSGVSFSNVEDVVAVNLSTGEWAERGEILLLPDGSFSGFVPVRQGRNRIRVSALASNAERGSTEIEIEFVATDLSDAEMRAELERIRARNREIELLLERERQRAFREQERRRALEIEVDDSGPGSEEESRP